MEFLHSNFPPVKTGGRSFSDAFYDLLPGTESLDIAVGYITSETMRWFIECLDDALKQADVRRFPPKEG